MPSISSTAGDAAVHPDSVPRARGPALPPMTRDRPFAWLLVITGVIGWLASGALVLEKLEVLKDPNHVTVCDVNPWISCGQVMQTPQSSVFGFPNMFIGIVAFAVIITTAMGSWPVPGCPVVLAGAPGWRDAGLRVRGLALVPGPVRDPHPLPVLHGGLGRHDPAVRLGERPQHFHGVIATPAGPPRIVGDAGWIITALLYVAVIATIFFAFIQVFIGTSGY